MKSTTENVVECVNAILKTLECSICLELLNNPVSTGCGHFFCRFCITETLQSNYRSPCPLCKKSFTRRGIQDAHQRKSILVAAKKLADVCETFAEVKFFNKDCSQKRVENAKVMPSLTNCENGSNATEKATRTLTGRKRKSKEKGATFVKGNDSLSVLEKIGTSQTDIEFLKENQYDSSNSDEIILTSNKRCRQSVEDSDSDDLPELEAIFQSDELSSIKNINVPTTVLATKTITNSNETSNGESGINSASKNISSTAKTNMKFSTSTLPKKNKSDNQNIDTFFKPPIEPQDAKGFKIKRKRRFTTQNLKEKNKINPLRNKTNELNIDDTTNNNINIAMNVIEEANKNFSSAFQEKIEEIGGNKDIIMENKHANDTSLILSPLKEICNKSGLKNVGPAKKSKSGDKQQGTSFKEQENLTKKLNETENFELTIERSELSISKNTIPCSFLINNSKEYYSLNEINIPELNDVEKTKKVVQSDEITDTAISVQSVASPDISKTELGTKSPGWSKVKQVGKDFRVKKFSKLSVEKNSSHNCSTEITSASSSESSETPKFKKLHDSSITNDVHNENLSKNSESTKATSSLENEVVGDKECVEQMPNRDKKITALSSELDQFDHTLEKDIDKIGCQTKVNLHSGDSEKWVYLGDCIEVESNITTLLSNDGSLLDVTSTIPAIDQVPSLSDGGSEIMKGTRKSDFDAEINYENENMCRTCEENKELDNFSANNEHLKQTENSDVHVKEVPIKNLSDANLHNVYNCNKINRNPTFQNQYYENGPSYVESVVSRENSFLEPNLSILPIANKLKEKKLFSKIGKLSKCEITATKSIFDKDESVYYTEHSQQTSQQLLEFYNDGQRKQKFFSEPIAALNIPSLPNTHGIVTKRSTWYNEVGKLNPMKFVLGPQNPKKTKVLKRTCLTLDEIQEAFANSSTSGTAETVCDLPFSSGDFQLHVCVSEETLNISVLKVVESEFDQLNIIQARQTVNETNIQTSHNNSQANSPIEIHPSSNVSTDSSQSDKNILDGDSKVKNNIFPYLNNYFPDSESVDMKESLNDSEVIPFQGSNRSLNKNKSGLSMLHLEEGIGNGFLPNDNSHKDHVPCSLLVSNKDENNKMETNEDNVELCVSIGSKTDSKLNDSSESLPPTLPYLGSKQSSVDGKINNTENLIADISKPTEEIFETDILPSEKIEELTDIRTNRQFIIPNSIDKANQFSNQKESNKCVSDDDDENNYFDELMSCQKTSVTSPSDFRINDSDGLSSDPAMAFASQLVVPLKNIATKMNSAGTKPNAKIQINTKISPEIFNSREKRSLQEFEELVFSLSKNPSNDSSVNKPSRLSLKSKRTAKKFKRIKKFESDDDSDENLDKSMKEELSTERHSSTKDKMEDVQVASSKTKGNELVCESIQEQSTLNSFCSEDITSKDPNELVMEVEDLNKKIYSVVEQLKQCGREDVLNQVLGKLQEKESPVSDKSDKDLSMSDDSEDSTDIFSQTVPPTPPGHTISGNDSVFKSSHCKQN